MDKFAFILIGLCLLYGAFQICKIHWENKQVAQYKKRAMHSTVKNESLEYLSESHKHSVRRTVAWVFLYLSLIMVAVSIILPIGDAVFAVVILLTLDSWEDAFIHMHMVYVLKKQGRLAK